MINYNVPLTEQHDNANIKFNYEIAREKLTFNSECVSNFENIVNEQYRLWRKYNYE